MTLELWSVLITLFDDDYEHHGEDSSTNYGPHVFSSREKAERYLRRTLYHCFKERAEVDERFSTYLDEKGCLIQDPLVLINDSINVGEYVPRLYSYNINEVAIDDQQVSDAESESTDQTK